MTPKEFLNSKEWTEGMSSFGGVFYKAMSELLDEYASIKMQEQREQTSNVVRNWANLPPHDNPRLNDVIGIIVNLIKNS